MKLIKRFNSGAAVTMLVLMVTGVMVSVMAGSSMYMLGLIRYHGRVKEAIRMVDVMENFAQGVQTARENNRLAVSAGAPPCPPPPATPTAPFNVTGPGGVVKTYCFPVGGLTVFDPEGGNTYVMDMTAGNINGQVEKSENEFYAHAAIPQGKWWAPARQAHYALELYMFKAMPYMSLALTDEAKAAGVGMESFFPTTAGVSVGQGLGPGVHAQAAANPPPATCNNITDDCISINVCPAWVIGGCLGVNAKYFYRERFSVGL